MEEQVRAAIAAAVHAAFRLAYPTVALVTDNEPFDWNAPPEHYVEMEIEFQGGRQIAIERNPRTRIHGHVYVTACTRAGNGASGVLNQLGWFSTALGFQRIGPVILDAPEPTGSAKVGGFYQQGLKVYFYADPT